MWSWRLVNAGLRMHIPSIVNMPMTLIAETATAAGSAAHPERSLHGAGKTYDVEVKRLRPARIQPGDARALDRQ